MAYHVSQAPLSTSQVLVLQPLLYALLGVKSWACLLGKPYLWTLALTLPLFSTALYTKYLPVSGLGKEGYIMGKKTFYVKKKKKGLNNGFG